MRTGRTFYSCFVYTLVRVVPQLPPETVEYFLNRGGCAPAEDDAVRLATLATEILGNDVVSRMCNTNDYLQAENADGTSRTGRAAMDDGEPITSISVQAPLEVLRQTLGVMSLPYVPDDREEPRP